VGDQCQRRDRVAVPAAVTAAGTGIVFGIVTYFGTAEFGFHLACGWGRPAKAIDAYVEYRHAVNDARVISGDREKGFYSIGGALRRRPISRRTVSPANHRSGSSAPPGALPARSR
jgi:hypothetical protein